MAWGLVSMTLRGLLSVVILLWTATSTDGRDVHVTCVFSEDCVLPCSFQPGSEEVIHWLKPEDKIMTVHSYYYSTDQLKQQSQNYRGRTALFNDQIPKGNASLLLRGLTLQDQGKYKCYTSTIKGNKESFINIAVEAPVRLVDIQLSDDIITCSYTAPVQGSPSSEVSIPCSVSQSDLLTFDLTWRFNQIVTILTSTKGTPQMYVVDKWKEQVQNLSDSGSLQLHKLTMVHQGTYSCELSTARDTHLILTYLQITPDKLSDVSDGLSPGAITGIIIAAAAVIIAAVICYRLRGYLPHCKSKMISKEMQTFSKNEDGMSLSAAANTNGPNENDQSGKPLQSEEEREETQKEEMSATSTILMPQNPGEDTDSGEDKEES